MSNYKKGEATVRNRNDRAKWFENVKSVLKAFVPKPKFVYLGERPDEDSVILSNHVGASAPVLYELYYDKPFRFWGTYEMTMGLKSTYDYLSSIYLNQKKHWNRYISKAAAFVACPFVNAFYQGIKLIPTYRDGRFKTTIKKSLETLCKGQSLIIFPEDSSDGYLDRLTQFFPGFTLLATLCLKQKKDLNIYVSYYLKSERTFIVDKPQRFSELVSRFTGDREKISESLCRRANLLPILYERKKKREERRRIRREKRKNRKADEKKI